MEKTSSSKSRTDYGPKPQTTKEEHHSPTTPTSSITKGISKSFIPSEESEPPSYALKPDSPTKSNHTSSSRTPKTIFRTSKLLAVDRSFRDKVSAFIDHSFSWSRTQFTTSEIEESLWIVLSIPTQVYINEPLPLSLSLKYLYPPSNENIPDFVAFRIMQFSVSLVEILNPADSSDLAGEEQREKRVFHQRTQKIMEFKAYGVDDAPTLALNKDLDLLNVFNKLNMPSKIVLPAAKGRSGETHFLQANAEVEYFGKEFLARWVDVPVSVIQGLQDEREGEEGSSSAPPNFGGYAALRLPKGETSMGGDGLPAYDDEVLSLDDGPGKAF